MFIICGTDQHDDDVPCWTNAVRTRRNKRRWIRSGKGRLTVGPRIKTKQLNSLQGIGTGDLPMHACAAASQPGVQHDYTNSNTSGHKVF